MGVGREAAAPEREDLVACRCPERGQSGTSTHALSLMTKAEN